MGVFFIITRLSFLFSAQFGTQANINRQLTSTYSVYKSSTIATMMTIRDTEKIWQPEPMSEENINGWLDGRNTSPCTCFHPYSSPRSLSCSITHKGLKSDITLDLTGAGTMHSALSTKYQNSLIANLVRKILPCRPFPPLYYIWHNPFLMFSLGSWTPAPPEKWPSWRNWRLRTSESKTNTGKPTNITSDHINLIMSKKNTLHISNISGYFSHTLSWLCKPSEACII